MKVVTRNGWDAGRDVQQQVLGDGFLVQVNAMLLACAHAGIGPRGAVYQHILQYPASQFLRRAASGRHVGKHLITRLTRCAPDVRPLGFGIGDDLITAKTQVAACSLTICKPLEENVTQGSRSPKS